MKTLHLQVDPLRVEASRAAIAEAAMILRGGGTVAFATETVYGLGANALDAAAVAKIFEAKGRPAWDPLIVHLSGRAQLAGVAEGVPEPARLWMEHFWPGPLTLLLPRAAAVPLAVTAGRSRVGVRVPSHPVARALLAAAGVPVAAPSANRFGHVSPTTAEHVLADLDGRIDAVLDAGPTAFGVESTVVDACEDPCVVYRPGSVTLEALAAVWPRVTRYGDAGGRAADQAIAQPASPGLEPASLPSPGVGLRHYAPRAALVLVPFGPGQAGALVAAIGSGVGTGVLLPVGLLRADALPAGVTTFAWGAWAEVEVLAQRLFLGLRALDAAGVRRIVCPLPLAQGVGAAVCDRLLKAARPR